MSTARHGTGGGAFDPLDRHVYFAAGQAKRYPRHVVLSVDQLKGKAGERHLVELLDQDHRVLLDPGIGALAAAHRRKAGLTAREAASLPPESVPGYAVLRDRYVELATRHGERLWGYLELPQGGRNCKRRTRQELHLEGLRPIPVYQPLTDGWDYFDELAAGYDRIAWGDVAGATAPVRVRMLHTAWERRRRYPDLWVHMLGLALSEWCLSTPPDSACSAAWLNPLRFTDVQPSTAAVRRLGDLGAGFAYDQRQPQDSPAGRLAAQAAYAGEVEHAGVVWRDVLGRARALGDPPFPARSSLEGVVEPARKDAPA